MVKEKEEKKSKVPLGVKNEVFPDELSPPGPAGMVEASRFTLNLKLLKTMGFIK